jgi:hypothetical protein
MIASLLAHWLNFSQALRVWLTPDLMNALFEGFASFFILNHARALWKTRQAYGISLLSTAFFATWGAWNIWYYPNLGQMFSFWAGLAVFFANLFWIYSIWWIRRKSK